MAKIIRLDAFRKWWKGSAKKAESPDVKCDVPMNELLTPAFVSRHARFADLEAMIAAGNEGKAPEDRSAPGREWDEFVRSVSSFPDWRAMLRPAGIEWAARQLRF